MQFIYVYLREKSQKISKDKVLLHECILYDNMGGES